MKIAQRICLIALAAAPLVYFAACKKKTPDAPETVAPEPAPTINMTALIDGVNWNSYQTIATFINDTFKITGIDVSTMEFITLQAMTTRVGTSILSYKYPPNNGIYNADSVPTLIPYANKGFYANYPADSIGGQLTITKIDKVNKTVSGTFLFKGMRASDKRSASVKLGFFTDVRYYTALNQIPGNDMLTCVINDTVNYIAQYPLTVTRMSHQLSITGNVPTTDTLVSLLMPDTVKVGSYNINPLDPTYFIGFTLTSSAITATPLSGNITITSHDTVLHRVMGTFTADMQALSTPTVTTYKITNGKFTANYKL